MDYALVITTTPTVADAAALAKGALETRLAACVQRWPIVSDAWWLGEIQHSEETLVQFKTQGRLVESLKHFILNNHPYKTPQIIVQELQGGSPAFLRWITDETTGGRL